MKCKLNKDQFYQFIVNNQALVVLISIKLTLDTIGVVKIIVYDSLEQRNFEMLCQKRC